MGSQQGARSSSREIGGLARTPRRARSASPHEDCEGPVGARTVGSVSVERAMMLPLWLFRPRRSPIESRYAT